MHKSIRKQHLSSINEPFFEGTINLSNSWLCRVWAYVTLSKGIQQIKILCGFCRKVQRLVMSDTACKGCYRNKKGRQTDCPQRAMFAFTSGHTGFVSQVCVELLLEISNIQWDSLLMQTPYYLLHRIIKVWLDKYRNFCIPVCGFLWFTCLKKTPIVTE